MFPDDESRWHGRSKKASWNSQLVRILICCLVCDLANGVIALFKMLGVADVKVGSRTSVS